MLAGVIERPTKDLDAVAIHQAGALFSAHPLPSFLKTAVQDVARAYGLADDWLNGGPTDLLDPGLPEGFIDRATARRFGPLTIRVAHRFDQIHFKLYAVVDQGPRSKHMDDLQRLSPTTDELSTAADWCRAHDPSPAFEEMLLQALEALGGSDG
ncbi:MAG: hypothetical protein IT384_03875 [Deltaproteobacteria bacterium]|nr:hypothetical protein [Deltaproteobacteria bacterium]